MPTESFFSQSSLAYIASAGAGKDGKAYSIKPIDGTGDFTFSRGSNLAATRVGAGPNFYIEKGRENLLLQSNQFDTTWTSSTTNASVTSGQTDPNGGSTSWLITEANDGGSIRQSVSVSGVFTFSMYLKYNSGTNQSASLFCTNNNQNATFNFSTGVPSGLNNLIDASMEDVGGGWYRCSVTLNASSSSTMILFPNNGGGIGSCFAWNAQVEQGLVATDYIETGASTAQSGILEDLPRLDYSGGASCPALLLEPSRTNRILQSEYFGDSLWNGGQSRDYNLTYTNELTPQGLAGSYKYESTASNNQLGAITNASTGTTITNSIYVKRVSGTGNVKLRNVNNTHTDFSLSVADGWKRIDVTGTLLSTTARFYVNLDDVGDEILIWAAQQEIGSYPTSIIPTYGSAVTRSGDDMDTNFGSALTSSGSVSVLFDFGAAYISDSNSTNNNLEFVFDNGDRIIYNQNSVSQHRIELNVNGGTEFIYKTFGILRSIPAKICVVVTNKTYKIFVNGQLTSSVGSFTGTADWTAAERFSSDINAAIGVTPIKQMLFFPTALTDSECIALTTI